MRKLNQKGFTIIELLVVIVIISILVALALPNLFAAQARGRDADRKNELKNLQQKLETHFGDNGTYPETLAGLDPAPTTDESTDPKNAAYSYAPLDETGAACTGGANCETYTLTAVLENKDDSEGVDVTVGTETERHYIINSVNQ